MSEAALHEAARLLAVHAGLRLDPAVRGRLAGAVREAAKDRAESSAEYVTHLNRDPAVLQDLVDRVTVQETSFFRDPNQFLAFANDVLPALTSSGAPVQVWSAGCSNGQEAYSLAMVLAESGLDHWQVTATDISTRALARTAQGRYAERELGGLSPARTERFLVPAAEKIDTWEVAPELRRRVKVLRNNLAADPPPIPAGRCQVVFCRNVLIYFGRDDLVAFLNRLSAWLPPDGHLFLGYSESLWQVSERFHLVRLGDAFVYRNGPADHPGAAPWSGAGQGSPLAAASLTAPPPLTPPAPRPTLLPLPASSLPTPPGPALPDTPRSQPPSSSHPGLRELLAEGEGAMSAKNYASAIMAFRKAAFLDPDQPVAYLSLGLALEALGDLVGAQRAFAAARGSLSRCDPAAIENTLEGYHLDEFTRLLDLKAGAT